MLENEFFQTQAYNAGPYPVINLSGAEKYEQNTVFRPGKYRIELAPGKDFGGGSLAPYGYIVNMDLTDTITQPFIIRAYCGSDATSLNDPGYNLYTGPFKVNAVDVNTISANSPVPPIDVNHIFGAGGGNGYNTGSGIAPLNTYKRSGGANCLGDGNFTSHHTMGGINKASGAGSCLHLLPVGGVFGTDYIRAYHAAPVSGCGSAYGGAGIPLLSIGEKDGHWFTRGGNSPYGNGATVLGTPGSGPGAGGRYLESNSIIGAGAYFNGTSWIDCPGNVLDNQGDGLVPSSYIRLTYLGPVGS